MTHTPLICLFFLLGSLNATPLSESTFQLEDLDNILVGLPRRMIREGLAIPIFKELGEKRVPMADTGVMVGKIRILKRGNGFIRML